MSPVEADPAALAPLAERLAGGDIKGCCASLYEHPAVRWLLGGELHPGGEDLTRRCLELIGVESDDRLLDVASGTGSTALLAAGEAGCEAVGVDYGSGAVAEANRLAAERGLAERASFVQGDAEALPFADASFDAVICECSLCTFPDKPTAVAEIARVLRPGGRLVVSDVIAEHDRLPDSLRGAMATVACVGSALPLAGYRELLAEAGFEPIANESRAEEVAATCERVRDRLRGARILGLDGVGAPAGGLDAAIALAGEARRAIADGALGYAIFAARLPG